eukprot:INCI15989.1.p1 GENE.INCI15989.1~~INCI15989.1.p1  ORF type:complete len:701 (+),score=109.16 INCI15989.1:253-2103(+)
MSLPQLAVVYPSVFRRLLRNLRVYIPAFGRIDPLGNRTGADAYSNAKHPKDRSHHHHHRHHHRHPRHEHEEMLQHLDEATPGSLSSKRQLFATSRDVSMLSFAPATHAGDQTSREEVGENGFPSEGNADFTVVPRKQLAKKLLPVVSGSSEPTVDAGFWLDNESYQEAADTADANFQLPKVAPEMVVAPLPYLSHPFMFKHLLYNHKLRDCLHSPAVVPILQFKWIHHTGTLFRRELYLFMAFVATVTFAAMFLTVEDSVRLTGDVESGFQAMTFSTSAQSGLLFVIQIINFIYIFRLGVHLYHERWLAMRSLWMWQALVMVVLVELMIILHVLRRPTTVVAASLLVLVVWSRLLFYMRAHSATGALVRMLIEILKDMRHFVVILLVILMGFSTAMHVLLNPRSGGRSTDGSDEALVSHANPLRSLVQMWNGVMGAFEFSIYDAAQFSWLAWLLYVSFTFIVIIVMLNLLIALMGDSYERVNNQKEQARQLELAGIIIDTETQMRLRPYDKKTGLPNPDWQHFFPKWVVVLQDPDPKVNDIRWTSRTRMVTNSISKRTSELGKRLEKRVDDAEHRHARQLRRSTHDLMHQLHILLGDSSSSESSSESSDTSDSEST